MRIARGHVRLLAVAAGVALALGSAAPSGATPQSHNSHWRKIHGDTTNGVSCPTTKLCVGIDGNKVTWTTNPTASKPHWRHAALEPGMQPDVIGGVILDALTCAGPHFCLAADDLGKVFATTNPTGGKHAWHAAEVDDIEILGISCSSPSMCAALDYNGLALTSTDAGAANPTWSHVSLNVAPNNNFYSVSCAGHSVCAAVEDDSRIRYTDNPSAASPTWHVAKAGHHVWDGISCPTAHKCIAVGAFDGGHVVAVSSNPAAGSHSWKTSKIPAPRLAEGSYLIDCATKSFCFTAGGADGYSTHAAPKKSAWHSVVAPTNFSQTALSCVNSKWCFVGTVSGTLAWHR